MGFGLRSVEIRLHTVRFYKSDCAQSDRRLGVSAFSRPQILKVAIAVKCLSRPGKVVHHDKQKYDDDHNENSDKRNRVPDFFTLFCSAVTSNTYAVKAVHNLNAQRTRAVTAFWADVFKLLLCWDFAAAEIADARFLFFQSDRSNIFGPGVSFLIRRPSRSFRMPSRSFLVRTLLLFDKALRPVGFLLLLPDFSHD